MTTLLTKTLLLDEKTSLELWQKDAFQQFNSLITDEQQLFPCLPAQIGYSSDHLRFAFAGDPREQQSIKTLAHILKEYSECSRDTGNYASLVVFFHTPPDLKDYSVQQFEQVFWETINNLTAYDEKPWPEHISTKPEDASWEFCFNGEPFFCFCSTPSHSLRRSRYFPGFLLAFQPRWVFEKINKDTGLGQKLKQTVRDRLKTYDDIEAHPSLSWYGEENNLEWKQYYLRDNQSTPAKCPFSQMMKSEIKD
ncbi:YqcI/YcgG family protein [Bacillus sp. HMF5848]|uniref:YqcI/YcgG family protein n=1 Tax=Bacillus sp. HMF5848 TaxID=2495421 RepID=UPI000F76AB77|nr:YqcI/YcgG family protein [Bacillus sp. HMF5848]RSK29094.1 YqcI/YcgG family protein [Bacillus sp. HMF5848]